MKLEDKIAVITGGNSGIGFATAQELKRLGARVVIIGRNPDAVAKAAAELGDDTLGITADVSSVADLDRAFAEVREAVGRVDILFANAGIGRFAPLGECTEALFDEITNTNFKGAYFTILRCLPLMPNGGSIVLTSTVAVHFGLPGASIYAAGKAALNSLAKTLAIELAARRIRVNIISPGPVMTPIFGKMGMDQETQNQVAAGLLQGIPLQRFGTSEEIARCVAFLAADDAAFITGQELVADGDVSILINNIIINITIIMNAPDLTQRPPRSPRVRLGGYTILPRILDKIRAGLAGTAGEYIYKNPNDWHFFRFTGIDPAALQAHVATGAGDWNVLTWVNENAPLKHTPLEISQWSDWTQTVSFNDVEMREWYTEQIKRLNPAREDLRGTFDYLDLDDFVSFGGVA